MNIKKIQEMRAKREDCRLKAMAILNKAESETRFINDEETRQLEELETEIRGWDENIKKAEKMLSLTPEVTPESRMTDEEIEVKSSPSKNENRFATFGEQMLAVYRAVCPAGKVDARLTTRAASGLNESNPTDGGFLVQQDFVVIFLCLGDIF